MTDQRTATLLTLAPGICFGAMWAVLFYGAGPHGIWNLTVLEMRVVFGASVLFAPAAAVFAAVLGRKHKGARLSAVVTIIGYTVFMAWALPITLSIPWGYE